MLNLDKEELYDGKTFDEYFNVHWSHCIDEVKKYKCLKNKPLDLDEYLFSGFGGLLFKFCLIVLILSGLFCFFAFFNYLIQFIKLYHVICFSFIYVIIRLFVGCIKYF